MNITGKILLAIGAGAVVGFGMAELFTPANSVVEAIPSRSASDSSWIQWHMDLSSRFGQTNANAIFMNAFSTINPTNVDTSNFRAYLKSVGIQYSGTVLDSIQDFTTGVIGDIGSGIGSIFNAGKILTYIVVGGGVLALVLIVVSVTKHPEVIKAAAVA